LISGNKSRVVDTGTERDNMITAVISAAVADINRDAITIGREVCEVPGLDHIEKAVDFNN